MDVKLMMMMMMMMMMMKQNNSHGKIMNVSMKILLTVCCNWVFSIFYKIIII